MARTSTPLKALVIEDREDDAELLVLELRRAGYDLEFRRVDSAATLRQALDETWQIIYSDFQLGSFTALDALTIVRRERHLDTPFIVVSGTVGEDVAVEAMRAGADDYFRKEHLERLAQATARSLRESLNRRLLVAERSSNRLERRLHAMTSAAPFAVAILEGPHFICRFQNEAHVRMFGRVRGRRFGEASPDIAADVLPDLERVLKSGKAMERRERATRCPSDGGEFVDCVLNLVFVPIRDDDGAIEAVAVLAVDVTHEVELRKAAHAARIEAENANRLKDEFLAVLSHELRTPLNAMLGWTMMLKQGALDERRRTRAIETIERSAREQARLIEDLLDVSRIAMGKLQIVATSVDLAAVVQAAVDAVRPAAHAKGIALDVELSPEGSPVYGDAGRLQQVVWNLLSNAVKFTPRDGRVGVRLERDASRAKLTVSDSGIGIAPEFLPHVFDRFRQADSTTTRHHGGLGIGLAIAKELVALHGGELHAESAGPGHGARFVMLVPIRVADRETRVPVTPRERSAPMLGGLRVLLVEDDADAREIVVTTLEGAGAVVREAESAAEALETLDVWVPDVLLSDIGLAGEDGYAFIQKVRSRPAERGGWVPAAALTAYAGSEDARRAMVAGFQVHLPKPVDPERLLRVTEDLAEWSRKR